MATTPQPATVPGQITVSQRTDGVTLYSVHEVGLVARVEFVDGWQVTRRWGPDPSQWRTRKVVTREYAENLAKTHAERYL